jgi:cysteinyl-tRNA synthetase
MEGWSELVAEDPDELAPVTPFVELLVRIRSSLRASNQWDLADEIRDGLLDLGVILEDGAQQTTWRQEQ